MQICAINASLGSPTPILGDEFLAHIVCYHWDLRSRVRVRVPTPNQSGFPPYKYSYIREGNETVLILYFCFIWGLCIYKVILFVYIQGRGRKDYSQ